MNFCLRPKAIDVAVPGENVVPPAVPDDLALRGRAAELHRQLSKMREPVVAPRDQLVINFDFDVSSFESVKGDASTSQRPSHTRESTAAGAETNSAAGVIDLYETSAAILQAVCAQPQAARTASRPPNSDSKAATEDGAAGPHLQPRGFVRVRSVRTPPRPAVDSQPQCFEVLLAAERGVRDSGCVYKTHEQRLRERLERLNLEMLIVAGDGNCQFRSISNELYGSQEHHALIRRQVVAHIAGQRSTYAAFLGADFDDYLTQMARCGAWGDELTLRAVCDSFGIKIHVVTSETDNWYLTYEPESQKVEREIFLTYIAPIHYNSIRRQSSLKTMALSFSRGLQRLGSSSMLPPPRTTSGNSGLASNSFGPQSPDSTPPAPSGPSATTIITAIADVSSAPSDKSQVPLVGPAS